MPRDRTTEGEEHMKREEILKAAEKCVNGDRDKLLSRSPEDNFNAIAKLWSAYLEIEVGPEDVALMMALFKIARLKGSGYRSEDSWVDACGYMACGGEIATGASSSPFPIEEA